MSTRESILKAALELFSSKSYAEVSIDEIAAKAGVSKGAVFHYFSSKIDLGEAVMRHILEAAERRIEEALSSNTDVKEKLGRLIDMALEYVELKGSSPRSLNFVSEICRKLAEGNRYGAVEEFYRRLRQRISDMLGGEGVKRSGTRAAIFMIFLNGLLHYTFFYPKPLSRDFVDEVKREMVEVILA